MDEAIIVDSSDEHISVTCGVALWETAKGLIYLEEDYRVAGEVWRVHLNDPDPFPSRPHAHCIGGRFASYKLHLGTRHLIPQHHPAVRNVKDPFTPPVSLL
jgi:hypothetical protein